MWPFWTSTPAQQTPPPVTEADLKQLPSYFPVTTKACAVSAQTFFDCFSANSKKNDALDTQAGQRALEACMEQHKAYRECMDLALMGAAKDRRFRVQEEYRNKA